MKVLCWNALLAMTVGIAVSGLSLRPSSTSTFHGSPLLVWKEENKDADSDHRAQLYMRKQKASDKRTRRRQRGEVMDEPTITLPSVTTSPMNVQGEWKQKTTTRSALLGKQVTGGRGRSRKRSMLYSSLSFYSNKFMHLLQAEYKAEEEEVLGRIKASLDEPISLEVAGYALYDMEASRRGNLFSDEVYRLTKAADATTLYDTKSENDDNSKAPRKGNTYKSSMPPNHKFRPNDVILLTLQPKGSGDFFDPTTTSPLSEEATQLEARVLNVGPTYVDIVTQAGKFASSLGPAPNEDGGGPKRQSQRIRVDRFFSDIPYQRMVAALNQLSQIPDRQQEIVPEKKGDNGYSNPLARIHMDTILAHVIVSTHAYADPESPLLRDPGVCDLDEIAKHIAKPPMANSVKLAHQAIRYMQAQPQVFRQLNGPQLAAVEAALTRRLTLVHGPPGTGKTTVSASIGFGMVHQCRSISSDSAKVLACAFSNIGADNLAQALQGVGLNVLRIGKPSAVTHALWNSTLDAAIDRDPDARKALEVAASATARLSKVKYMDKTEERLVRQGATEAVKASQTACLVAASRAMREVDVIVTTSTGAADPRLMAACGIITGDQKEDDSSRNPFGSLNPGVKSADDRKLAPDGLAPLSLPFVIVDEACQSVEPATLIPLVSSDTCRSLVLLGDPCQLPPTVRSDSDNTSPLSVSLMERLASALPPPNVRSPMDLSPMDTTYLQALPIKQCRSLLHALEKEEDHQRSSSYRKRFAGSVLLSIQYRMHPSIAAYPSAIFYDGLLASPEFMNNVRHAPKILQKLFPMSNDKNQDLCVRWVNVGGRNNERRGSLSSLARTSFGVTSEAIEEQTSYLNELEAEQIMNLLKDIVSSGDREVQSIGVISPYSAQVQLIQSLSTNNLSLQDQLLEHNIDLEINTVDGYQGRERDVIIFSAVRSNRHGKIGFLRDWRRMNVALTRAKSFSVVVGDLETLSDSDKNWAALGKWSEGVGCVVEIAETQIGGEYDKN